MNLTIFVAGRFPAWITAGLLALGLLFLALQKKHLAGWTLTTPWGWCMASMITIGLCEVILGASGTSGTTAASGSDELRFMAAVSSFCPAMSLMGARRPQHHAWNFVVFSLWVVVALPAVKACVLQQRFELHSIVGWFAWLLIALGAANMLPTRFWLPALLVAAAQVLLLGAQLPLLHVQLAGVAVCLAMAAATSAAACSWWLLSVPLPHADSLEQRWIIFRNRFGALWGLRLAERFNASARSRKWPLTLTWWGFQFQGPVESFEQLPPSVQQAASRTLRNLWRRFAPPDW